MGELTEFHVIGVIVFIGLLIVIINENIKYKNNVKKINKGE
jgi:hypothetical protein